MGFVFFFYLAVLGEDQSVVDVGVAAGVSLAVVVITVVSALAVFLWRR